MGILVLTGFTFLVSIFNYVCKCMYGHMNTGGLTSQKKALDLLNPELPNKDAGKQTLVRPGSASLEHADEQQRQK